MSHLIVHRSVGAVLLLSAAFLLAACQSPDPGATGGASAATESADAEESTAESAAESQEALPGGQLTIATGGTAGVYYPLGGGLANIISDNIEGYTATVTETGASVDNMFLIESGDADIAFSLGDTAADAAAGTGDDFEGEPIEICALARIYNNFTQPITSADSGITSIEDLRDKAVSLGDTGSGTEVIALRILEAAGIDPDTDIERHQLGIGDTVTALKDGTIDAGFWSGGVPTAGVTDYASTDDLVIIPTGEYAEAMAEEYGEFYLEEPISAGAYEDLSEDVSSVVVPNVLVVSPQMPEELQYQLTALLFDQRDALIETHAAAEGIDIEAAGEVPFMDVCPGSQRYYDEQG